MGHQMGEHQQRAATNRPSGAPCHNVTQSLGERGAAGGSSNDERQSARRGVRPQQVPKQEAASVSGDRYSLTPHEGTLPHPQPSARPSIGATAPAPTSGNIMLLYIVATHTKCVECHSACISTYILNSTIHIMSTSVMLPRPFTVVGPCMHTTNYVSYCISDISFCVY